jgi:hypothetical protein
MDKFLVDPWRQPGFKLQSTFGKVSLIAAGRGLGLGEVQRTSLTCADFGGKIRAQPLLLAGGISMLVARDRWFGHAKWAPVLLLALFVGPLLFAQDVARVLTVDPASGKVNDEVTLTGEHLGKENVAAVFLSDDTEDFKATLVQQADDKIVMKVPQTKPGDYNVSIQVSDHILIMPVKFSVTQ